jgi:hypothetical protein
MSSRASFIAYIKPILASTEGLEKIKLIESVRATDQLSSRPLLIVKTDSFEKLVEAPRFVQANFTLVLVSPHLDVDKAEDQLDEILGTLLPTLRDNNVMWERATQTAYDDQHISYDITIRSILS